MAEKRGETEKLKYDFNTAGVLEVYMTNLNGWYRTTAKEFRSFNGPRRITIPTEIEHGNVVVPMETFEYYGPVYQFGSNKVVEFSDTGSIEKSELWEKSRKISEQRG